MSTAFLERPLWRHIMSVVSAVVLLAGLGWSIGRPHAEDFIKETVEKKISEIAKKTDNVRSAVGRNNAKIQKILNEQERAKVDRATQKGACQGTARSIPQHPVRNSTP